MCTWVYYKNSAYRIVDLNKKLNWKLNISENLMREREREKLHRHCAERNFVKISWPNCLKAL